MEELISEKAAKFLDLLEQIESVNEMIDLHKDDPFMLDQYSERKEGFIKDLVELLGEYQILPEDLAA
jgi:hypothetical protein